jgi:RNA polymerase sigma-70 factor (ECF subfamily)
MAGPDAAPLAAAFREHERHLWGLAYRMTGSASDADDVVQDTFERASLHPPARTEELRPWLVRVAVNVARDALRARKVRSYVGPWLPAPIEETAMGPVAEIPDARYELRESASYAFLLALEALTPAQRAVLLLRDVLDYSVRETGEALELTDTNVKVIHHRARRAMGSYDRTRAVPFALEASTRAALQRFLVAVMSDDAAGVEACLAADARLLSDGGGEYRAALRPVLGANRIQRFFLGLMRKLGAAGRFEVRSLNGLPAIVAEYDDPREGWGPRFVMRCDVDPTGAIREVHIVVAGEKLTAVSRLA